MHYFLQDHPKYPWAVCFGEEAAKQSPSNDSAWANTSQVSAVHSKLSLSMAISKIYV